jgi:hypothetical protein
MNLAQRFMAAFEGFSAAHGQTQISEERRAGKQKAKSFIVRKPLTLELIEGHLSGTHGVGSIPINEENKCKFGALDIDKYPLDLVMIDKRLRQDNIPAIVCRSKSGGAHVFFFFSEWISAGEFRDKAGEISAFLGYGGCEVFPKQEQILVERGDVGNFINMPYFDHEQTMRYAIKEDGSEATLEEFLDMVDAVKIDGDTFADLKLGKQIDEFAEWPPCLATMFAQGLPEGGRNTTMFATCVAAKKEQPEEWKNRVETLNMRICNPPLPASEIVTLQKQHEKKEYGFPCEQEPLKSYCNKALCRTKSCGIGGGAVAEVSVSGLSVVKSEPPLWFCDVGGRRVELTTDELQTPQRFQKAVMEQVHTMPPQMKIGDWQVLVSAMMQDMSEIEVPEELTYKGQFVSHLEAFCTGRVQAQSPEELALGKPFNEDGKVFFKLESLIKYLRNQKFEAYNRGQIQERLKELNSDGAANAHKKFKTTKGEWKNFRVWWVPEFKEEVEVPSIEIREQEVPF